MAHVTYKNRSSSDYRFTCKSLDDPAIADLKAMLIEENNYIKRARKSGFTFFAQKPTRGLRIRPRGLVHLSGQRILLGKTQLITTFTFGSTTNGYGSSSIS